MKKLLSLMLILVLVATCFCACKSEQEKKEEAIEGDWYASFMGSMNAKYHYEDGKFTNYLIMNGNETKMAWGTYTVKGNKIYEKVEDVADVDGLKPSKNSEPKKFTYKDGKVTKIYTDQLEFTREKP